MAPAGDGAVCLLPPDAPPGWRRACLVLLEEMAARSPQGLPPLTLAPLTDPLGQTVEHLIEVKGRARALNLVHAGRYIEPGAGLEAAAAYLADLGFPARRPLSRHLLAELLAYFGVIGEPFYPNAHTWPEVDAHFLDHNLPLPELRYGPGEPPTATFTLAAFLDGLTGGGYMAPERHRLVLTFAPDGAIAGRVER